MTTEVAKRDMGAFDERDEQLVRYLGLNPTSPQDRAAVAVCREYGFDPILKHVVVIPKGGVYITRDGLLNVAHRSGQFDGMVVEQDPKLEADEWVAKVSVYRKDMSHPFTYPGRYPANGANRQYAPEMALKCAEAHALRRAFDVAGLPTLDERLPVERQESPTVSAADFTGQPADDTVDGEVIETPPEPEPESEPQPAPTVNRKAQNRMFMMFDQLGMADVKSEQGRQMRLDYIANAIGHPIESSNDLSANEMRVVHAMLEKDVSEAAS